MTESDNANDDLIRQVLTQSKTIAIVGASNNPDRPSYGVMAFLLERGYICLPVNPGLAGQTILGQAVVASLADIADPVDIVDIFRNSEAAAAAVDQAIAIKAKTVWMQLGVIHDEAAARARAAGLTVIMDRCPKIEIPRLGLSQ